MRDRRLICSGKKSGAARNTARISLIGKNYKRTSVMVMNHLLHRQKVIGCLSRSHLALFAIAAGQACGVWSTARFQ
jgi:hypothetical protein